MFSLKVFLCAVAAAQVLVVNGFTAVGPSSPMRQSALYMNVKETGTKEIKVGVIGCGRIGLVHLEAITKAPGVTPVIVSNPTVSKAEAAAKQYNVKKFTNDAYEVIEDPEVDAVWICSPSHSMPNKLRLLLPMENTFSAKSQLPPIWERLWKLSMPATKLELSS
jgi:threonine dehydrogenase-like Zn-dependent dehydrogenase